MKKLVGLFITVSFVLFLSFFSSPTNTYADSSENEPNNSIAEANSISVNEYITGVTDDYYDEDYFKFTLSKDGYVRLVADNRPGEDTTFDIFNETEEFSNYLNTNHDYSGTSQLEMGLPKGTYYIKVDSSYTENPYKFKIEFQASSFYEKEPNNSYAEAENNKLELNKTYKGFLSKDYYEEDYFKISNSRSGKYTIIVDNKGSDQKQVYITTKDGNVIDSLYTNTDFPGNSQMTVGLPAGDFYIKLKSGGGEENPYNLTVNFEQSTVFEQEFNNTFATANSIDLNKTYNGVISDWDDEDYYTFQLSKPEKVTLNLNNGINKIPFPIVLQL